jgi:hypothetical protein
MALERGDHESIELEAAPPLVVDDTHIVVAFNNVMISRYHVPNFEMVVSSLAKCTSQQRSYSTRRLRCSLFECVAISKGARLAIDG